MAADVPIVAVAAETVSVPEKVLLPLKVCVPARIANSLEVLGSVKVRVVAVLIPDSENTARLVGSASFTRLKMASDTSCGTPTSFQIVPVQAAATASSAIQASQPGRGTSRIQTPSTQVVTFRSHPAQSPVAPEATM